MEVKTQEVLEVLDDLLASLGLQLEEYDIVYLTQAELYVEMFKVMFPELGPKLEIDFDQDDIDDQQIIQSLIEFLSEYILKMDLDHISGEFITKGDLKHILNFIQLLNEISKMLIAREDEDEEAEHNGKSHKKGLQREIAVQSSPTSFNRPSERSLEVDWKENKHNTAQGIASEFSDQQASGEGVQVQTEGDSCVEEIATMLGQKLRSGQNMGKEKPAQDQKRSQTKSSSKQDSNSGSRISEVSRSKGSSEYEMKKLSGVDNQFENFDSNELERQRYIEEYEDGDEGEGEYEEEIVEEAEEEEEEDPDDDDNANNSRGKTNSRSERKNETDEQPVEDEEDEGKVDITEEQEELEDLEYYTHDHDPINYKMINNKASGHLKEHSRSQEDHQRRLESSNGHGDAEEDEEGEEPDENYPEELEDGNEYDEEEEEEDEDEEEEQEQEQEEEEYSERLVNTDNQYEQDYPSEREVHQERGESRRTGSSHGQEEIREEEDEEEENTPMKGKMQREEPIKKKKKVKVNSEKTRPKTAPRPRVPKIELRPLRTPTSYLALSSKHYDDKPLEKKATKKKTKNGKVKKLKMKSKMRLCGPSKIAIELKNLNGTEDYNRYEEIQPRQGGAPESGMEDSHNDEMKRYMLEQARKQAAYEKHQRKREREALKRQTIRIKGESLKKAYEGQQEVMYHTMRDHKLNYVKKMNRAIYKLEEKKTTDDKHMFLDLKRTQDHEMWNMMTFMRSNYTEKMETMRKDYTHGRKETKTTGKAQKMFIKTLRRELTLDQFKEIEKLQERWERETMRLNFLKRDEAFLDKRLAMIFQK